MVVAYCDAGMRACETWNPAKNTAIATERTPSPELLTQGRREPHRLKTHHLVLDIVCCGASRRTTSGCFFGHRVLVDKT
jgi:hypothetical protein